jgi:hypothetical protein
MAKGNNQKMANGSTPEFEAQLWAAAERAEPAFNYKRRERWPCASTPRNTGSFRADLHPDLKADFILANPPLNMSDWSCGGGMRQDVLKVRPISDHGNTNEIIRKFGGAGQFRNAVNQLQSLLYAT